MYEPDSGTSSILQPAPETLPSTEASTRSGAARYLPLVLSTALLSAALSAGFTYLAVASQGHAAMAAPSIASPAVTVQAISLSQSDAVVRVAELARPAVVTIATAGMTGVGPFSVPSSGAGSGFVVRSDGLILTNYHVVKDSRSLTVTLAEGKELEATLVSTDQAHDLALVHVSATGLSTLALGDSSAVQVGQLAIAVGSPLGTFTDSVTQGIVSGLDRNLSVGERGTDFSEDLSGLIQTDAAVNPGNSGGPLLDINARVVGVITASSSSAQGMGFAVPINQARALIAAAK
jgi:serine protease Do